MHMQTANCTLHRLDNVYLLYIVSCILLVLRLAASPRRRRYLMDFSFGLKISLGASTPQCSFNPARDQSNNIQLPQIRESMA